MVSVLLLGGFYVRRAAAEPNEFTTVIGRQLHASVSVGLSVCECGFLCIIQCGHFVCVG